MSDRDPTNADAIRAAIQAWHDVCTNYTYGKPTQDECDLADAALEQALLNQGCLSPDDVVDFFGPSDQGIEVRVFLATGESFTLESDGSVRSDYN